MNAGVIAIIVSDVLYCISRAGFASSAFPCLAVRVDFKGLCAGKDKKKRKEKKKKGSLDLTKSSELGELLRLCSQHD